MTLIRGISVFLLASFLGAGPAAAQGLFYARGAVGITNGDKLSAFGTNPADILRGNTGTSALYEVGLGRDVPIPIFGLRTELALAYRPNFRLDGSGSVAGKPASAMIGINQYTGMANVYLDAPSLFMLRPFIGGGAGAARNEAAGSNTDFAWNLAAGFSVHLLPMTNLDFTLRHVDAGQLNGALNLGTPPSSLSLHSQIRMNEGILGVRFNF